MPCHICVDGEWAEALRLMQWHKRGVVPMTTTNGNALMAVPAGDGVQFVRNFRIFTWGRHEQLKQEDFHARLLKRHCVWVPARFSTVRVVETVLEQLLCR